jgi:hypothetical protein
MAGNFNFVEMGSGSITWNGRDVGFLKDVSFGYTLEIEKLKTGNPLKLRGQKGKEVNAQIKAGLFEISNLDNVGMMLGGLAPANVGGSPVTVTMQSRTFATGYNGSGMQSITLDGANVSTGVDAPVVKNAAEDTTYTENDDYIVDYTLGVIYRNPGGAITSLENVHVTYKYTPPTGRQLNMGSAFAVEQKELIFTHVNNDTDQVTIIKFWLASVDGKPNFTFTDSGYVTADVTFDSIFDENGHPDSPLGTYYVGDAA